MPNILNLLSEETFSEKMNAKNAILEDIAEAISGGGGDAASAGSIATIETSPAAAAHAVGEYIYYNTKLYKVTAAIALGDTLTVGTNISETTVMGEVEEGKNTLGRIMLPNNTQSWGDDIVIATFINSTSANDTILTNFGKAENTIYYGGGFEVNIRADIFSDFDDSVSFNDSYAKNLFFKHVTFLGSYTLGFNSQNGLYIWAHTNIAKYVTAKLLPPSYPASEIKSMTAISIYIK